MSVIIPSLNDPTLSATVASVAREIEGRDAEVIVVGRDDARHVASFSRACFVESATQLYPGAARNLGVDHARGRILLFVDADCEAQPGWLAAHCERLSVEPCAVAGGVRFETASFWALGDNVSLFHEFLSDLPPSRRRFLPSLNLGVRREIWDAVGGFDPSLRSAEDLDLTARIGRAGFPLYFEPRATVRHLARRHGVGDVWRHFLTYGRNSIRVRRRYPEVFGRSVALRWPWGLLAGAPIIALAVTARMYATEAAVRRYWRVAPVVYLSKVAWCVSAARGLRHD